MDFVIVWAKDKGKRQPAAVLFIDDQHYENILAYNHAGSFLVRKLYIEAETECSKKPHWFIEVFNW